MSEETKSQINTETVDTVEESVKSPVPASPNSDEVANETKAAEKKLKEMSRKAKERGKPQSAQRTRSEVPVLKLNQNWVLGGLGLSAIIMVGYFIYKSRGAVIEPPPELQPFHHPPGKKESVATSSEKPNSFDLNSF